MKLRRSIFASLYIILISQISFSQQVNPINDSMPVKAGTVRKNSLGMEFVFVPSGEFMMGSSAVEIDLACAEAKKLGFDCKFGIEAEKPEHKITFKRGFWISKFEVTQAQWTSVMVTTLKQQRDKAGRISLLFSLVKKKYPISGEGPKYPIYYISWKEAKDFIQKMNAKNDEFIYSLPSEAEWEYSCRAGTKTLFSFGDILTSEQANFIYNGRYTGKTTEVGSYAPNAWGIYDMHGNVSEWCEDEYNDSYSNLPTDGTANLTVRGKLFGEDVRVIRGGSWNSGAFSQRSAERVWNFTNDHFGDTGFRIVARLK
jgi:formylglycine-generating enzyme required for sulfatase activity